MSAYAYYLRTPPDLTQPMPEGMRKMIFHRKPEYDHRFHCDIFGKAVFLRQLSIEEMQAHGLIPDPKNHLAAARKG